MPDKLAYNGAKGRPKGTMVFDIELLDMRPTPVNPPPDVKAPPADARRTATGISYKVLRPGTGTRHPTDLDRVTVHYSGWTTNGKLFDSSIARGEPMTIGTPACASRLATAKPSAPVPPRIATLSVFIEVNVPRAGQK